MKKTIHLEELIIDSHKYYIFGFNDHFCGRVPLITVHTFLQSRLSCIIRTKKEIYVKKKGWAFRWPLMVPSPKLNLESTFLQSCIQGLVQLNEFCRQNQTLRS